MVGIGYVAKLPQLSASLASLMATVAALDARERTDFSAMNAALDADEGVVNPEIAAIHQGTSQHLIVDGAPGVKSFTAPRAGYLRIILTGGGGGLHPPNWSAAVENISGALNP